MSDEIQALAPWFHNVHLPDGSQTAPDHFLGDFPRYKWEELAPWLPEDLEGWTVLDVGCNAGFYSIELARRGAQVTAIDMNEHYLRQARWVAGRFGLSEKIRFEQMQVYELCRVEQPFDLVLFLGVFYHLRYPLLGLDTVSRRVGKMMVFQTLTIPGEEVAPQVDDIQFEDRATLARPDWPRMAFIEGRLANDPTNWWAPNHSAVLALLRSCGMRVKARPGKETYLCVPDPEHASLIDDWDANEYAAVTGLRRGPGKPLQP